MSVLSLLNQIKDGEIVLPAIQRDFVWPEDSILTLLDSIMRGYPIGIILLWETYNDIRHRAFASDYKPDQEHNFRDNTERKKLRLVLDGQQRLQSLYVALYGTFEGKSLYFDILSGRDSDDLSDERFKFRFLSSKQIADWESSRARKTLDVGVPKDCFIKVTDLLAMGPRDRQALKKQLETGQNLSVDDATRLDVNLSQMDYALSKDTNVLKVSVVDEGLAANSRSRKSEADVLEIFVRVNTEGTQLKKSDLVFSMLKLNWKESAEDLPAFVRKINQGNSLELDTDFVIRCLFAVSELGTKFDLDLLRKRPNIQKLQGCFSQCCDSISSAVDFLQTHCWCASSELIGGYNTLIPLVYYLYHTHKHEINHGQIANARKAIYLFGFAKPFSRYGESRLWKFIKDELKPLADKKDEAFPLKRAIWWVSYWEGITSFGDRLLQANPHLVLHLVQGLSGAKVQYARNAGEIDHIFPRSILREKGFDESQINHFANFWILAKGKNQNKSNRPPAQYFKDVDDEEMRRALIDRDMLHYDKFPTFLKRRGGDILDEVRRKLQFSDSEFTSAFAQALAAMGVTAEKLAASVSKSVKA